ncbi:MAG TPA: DUF3881 family protein, partial [Blastocatellia bacterium]|nr:DUF3881 family protein [Blastocatellia bacterium]
MTTSEQPINPETESVAVMAELFGAIGFQITDERSYNWLIEYVDNNGARTRAQRGEATLHGRCWKISDGLEVWSVLYERDAQFYYADCRPAFRSRYVRSIFPWELIEYDEDGEAIVRGSIEEGPEVVFELQNLTEINTNVFRQTHLHVALAGLAYTASIAPDADSVAASKHPYRFELAESLAESADDACENDYLISGSVLAWRDLENSMTDTRLVWAYVDAGKVRLEVLVNRDALRGEIKIGAMMTASIWLQGHVLVDADISARYEGVDREYEPGDFWNKLRRSN